jgi:hypothetical protein
MVTGDHPKTAATIARQTMIIGPHENEPEHAVMTAAAFDALTPADLDNRPELPRVVARCSPDTKVKLVDALHRRGGVVGGYLSAFRPARQYLTQPLSFVGSSQAPVAFEQSSLPP